MANPYPGTQPAPQPVSGPGTQPGIPGQPGTPWSPAPQQVAGAAWGAVPQSGAQAGSTPQGQPGAANPPLTWAQPQPGMPWGQPCSLPAVAHTRGHRAGVDVTAAIAVTLAAVISVVEFFVIGTTFWWTGLYQYLIPLGLGAVTGIVGAVMLLTRGAQSRPRGRTLISLSAGVTFLHVFLTLFSEIDAVGLSGMFTDFTVLTVAAAALVIVAIVALLLPTRTLGAHQAAAPPQPHAYFPSAQQAPHPAQTPQGQWTSPPPAFPHTAVGEAGYQLQPQPFAQVPQAAGPPAARAGYPPQSQPLAQVPQVAGHLASPAVHAGYASQPQPFAAPQQAGPLDAAAFQAPAGSTPAAGAPSSTPAGEPVPATTQFGTPDTPFPAGAAVPPPGSATGYASPMPGTAAPEPSAPGSALPGSAAPEGSPAAGPEAVQTSIATPSTALSPADATTVAAAFPFRTATTAEPAPGAPADAATIAVTPDRAATEPGEPGRTP